MAQATQELGDDVVLMTSRGAPPEARHLGEYEVVFATDNSTNVPAAEHNASPAPARETPETSLGHLITELRDLRRQVMRQTAMRASDQPHWISGQPEMAELYAELVAAELDRDLVLELMLAVHGELDTGGVGSLRHDSQRALAEVHYDDQRSYSIRAIVRRELAGVFSVDATLGMPASGPRIVAFIGPPGAGKTAMLAKLAVKYGLPARRPVQLLSLENLRVGASEQLRTYAAILGMGFQAVETNHALGQALEEHSGKELILIDTPGFTAPGLKGGNDTSEYLKRRVDIQKHLVLPASMRLADLQRVAIAYEHFAPSRLIFTRLDETEALGPIVNEAVRTQLPLSFFGTGQLVPDDMEDASSAALLDRLLPDCSAGRRAAAA